MSEGRAKPIPQPDEVSAPFWAAAQNRQLAIQHCTSCGYYNHPPRAVCDACLSQDLSFTSVSGRGSIYSFTIMHQKDVAGFEHDAPFINIVVELDIQPMLLMVSNLPLAERERVKIGVAVEVYFDDRGDNVMVPQFKLMG